MLHVWQAGHVTVAITIGLLNATVASAGFVFTAQTRSVEGTAGGQLGRVSQKHTAPDFGVFDRTTAVSVPTYGGAADQHQRSELLPDRISVIGDVVLSYPAMVGTGNADSRSLTDVTFTVPATTLVQLDASATISGPYPSSRSISLTGPGTNITWGVSDPALFPWVSGSRSTTATLEPGSYRFLVNMASTTVSPVVVGSSYTGIVRSFNVQLTEVPEPGLIGASLPVLLPLLRIRSRRPDGDRH